MGNQFRLFETRDGIDVVRAQYLDMTGQRVPPGEQINGRRINREHIDLLSRIGQRDSGYRTPSAPARASSTGLAWLALDDPLCRSSRCCRGSPPRPSPISAAAVTRAARHQNPT